jgi:hypothetical protein
MANTTCRANEYASTPTFPRCIVDENCLSDFSLVINTTSRGPKTVTIVGKSTGFKHSNQKSSTAVSILVCGYEQLTMPKDEPIVLLMLKDEVYP